jgi:hypothetical protein
VMLVRRKSRSLKPNAAAIWDALRGQEYQEPPVARRETTTV